MDLDLDRFSQLGNILYVARKEEDYRERQTLSFVTYTLIAVNAGKKAPTSKEYQHKQKLDSEPEKRYLWDQPLSAEQKQKQGSAEKAAAQLRKNEREKGTWAMGIPDETIANEEVSAETERERRAARREEWGSMSVADLQEFKNRKNKGL